MLYNTNLYSSNLIYGPLMVESVIFQPSLVKYVLRIHNYDLRRYRHGRGRRTSTVPGCVVHSKSYMLQHCDTELVDKSRFTIGNLAGNKEYIVDVTLLLRSSIRYTAQHRG